MRWTRHKGDVIRQYFLNYEAMMREVTIRLGWQPHLDWNRIMPETIRSALADPRLGPRLLVPAGALEHVRQAPRGVDPGVTPAMLDDVVESFRALFAP